MKTVTFQIANANAAKRRTRDAFKGKKQGARISFAAPEVLFRLLTAKRWELIRAARRVGRDVKAVHGDVGMLLDAGILRKTGDSRIVFPFDAVHVDVMLHAA
jgi:predicted transcriptional regulator